jgi:hypothetical protein
MSVDPDALGNPPEDADQYLKKANTEDPRSDSGAPAEEPAGPQRPSDPKEPSSAGPI